MQAGAGGGVHQMEATQRRGEAAPERTEIGVIAHSYAHSRLQLGPQGI